MWPMSDMKDIWPRPHYNVPPKDHLHAVAVISLNYNIFKGGLFGLFRHHLEVSGMHRTLVERLYGALGGADHGQAIRDVFTFYEKDPAVIDRVEHMLAYFQWSFEARNLLMHSQQRGITLDDREDIMSLYKRSKKNYSKMNFMVFKVPELRKIADSIHAGYLYLVDLYFFLQVRDGQLPPWIPTTDEHRVLPDKSPIPKKIEVSDSHPIYVVSTTADPADQNQS